MFPNLRTGGNFQPALTKGTLRLVADSGDVE